MLFFQSNRFLIIFRSQIIKNMQQARPRNKYIVQYRTCQTSGITKVVFLDQLTRTVQVVSARSVLQVKKCMILQTSP